MLRIAFITIMLINVTVFAQQWVLLPNAVKDTCNDLYNVRFFDKDTGIIFAHATSFSSAIYRTTDGGHTWLKVWTSSQYGMEIQGFDISSIVICGKDTCWIGFEASSRASPISPLKFLPGILKTTDAGKTWELLLAPIIGANGDTMMNSHLFLSFPTATIGWCITQGHRFFRTSDGGKTWIEQTDIDTSALNPMPRPYYKPLIYFRDTLNGIVVVDSVIYRTNDGRHWIADRISWPFVPANIAIQSLNFINRDTGFVLLHTSWGFRTTDFGATWTKFILPFVPFHCDPFVASFVSADTGWCIGDDTCFNMVNDFCRDDLSQIMRTNDGGILWRRDPVTRTPVLLSDSSTYSCCLRDIFMLNDSTGWAVGTNGAVEIYSKKASSITSQNDHYTAMSSLLAVQIHGSLIDIRLPEPCRADLRLFDMNGRLAWSESRRELYKGGNTFLIPANKLVAGLYVLKIDADFGASRIPVFIQK